MKTKRKIQILYAASLCFAESGYERTSIETIARRAGVALGLVRYYFSSKENLYFEATQKVIKGLGEHLNGLDFSSLPPKEAVRLFILEYLRFTSESSNSYWMIYQESPFAILHQKEYAEALGSASLEILVILRDILEEVWPKDAMLKASIILASLHGIQRARFSLKFREILSFEGVADFFADNISESSQFLECNSVGMMSEIDHILLRR